MQPHNPIPQVVFGPASQAVLACVLLFSLSACATQPPDINTVVKTVSYSPLVGGGIKPVPVATSHPPKEDVFQGAQYDPPIAASAVYPNARQIRLRVGEVQEVFHDTRTPGDGQVQLAFHLPPEAASLVQLVVETKGFTRTYFLRARRAGETVGGVVERRWLDASGYRARDLADEARIQGAIKAQPYLIFIEQPLVSPTKP